MDGSLTIVELAARCRHYRDRSASLFEVSGKWSATAGSAAERIVLARLCTHASDHVTWWSQRLPEGDWQSPEPGPLEDLTEDLTEGPTPQGLVRLCLVVDELAAELSRWAAEHDADVDAPTARVLELVLTDLRRDSADLHAIT